MTIFLAAFVVWGRDPLTKKDASGFGKPTQGLGELLIHLPDDHPVKLEFRLMVEEINKFGGSVQEKDFGPYSFANHIPVSPNITIFRYNPSRLRAIDAMEEILHWKQIKEGELTGAIILNTLYIKNLKVNLSSWRTSLKEICWHGLTCHQ